MTRSASNVRRWAIRCIVGIFALLVLEIVFFYIVEDWRGSNEWNEYQKELLAKGETLDLRKLVPPGEPADDLSKVPIFVDYYQKPPPDLPRLRKIDVGLGAEESSKLPKLGSYLKGQPLDLAAWQKFYHDQPKVGLSASTATPAQDVLAALGRFDAEMKEVDDAVNGPNAFFPTRYEMPYGEPLGSATALISVAKVLQLQGVAHLENGEAVLAKTDFDNSFHLGLPLARRCTLVDYLVVVGIRAIDNSILWEGLHRHVWTDAQLREMESELAALDFLNLGQRALRVERASALQIMRYAQDGHLNQVTDMSSNQDLEDRAVSLEMLIFLYLRPSGWFDQEQLYLTQVTQSEIDAIHPDIGTVDTSTFDNWQDPRNSDDLWKINHLISGILIGPYMRVGLRVTQSETYCRLARLACRLEKYRLAHGKFPEQLDQLPDLPAHLNQEVVSTSPFHYHLEGDRYVLYSVGWSGADQNGVSDPDPQKGNWPWPCR